MFKVEGDKITITKGDTAELTIHATTTGSETFDYAIFAVANRAGTEKIFEEEYALTDGDFTVVLTNEVTDKFAPGQYKWQVRYVKNPTRDAQTEKIDGGDLVRTPWEPKDFVVQTVLSNF